MSFLCCPVRTLFTVHAFSIHLNLKVSLRTNLPVQVEAGDVSVSNSRSCVEHFRYKIFPTTQIRFVFFSAPDSLLFFICCLFLCSEITSSSRAEANVSFSNHCGQPLFYLCPFAVFVFNVLRDSNTTEGS